MSWATTPGDDEAVVETWYGMEGPTGEGGRLLSERRKLVEEFDPSRTEVPETVAVARAASTLRRISRLVRFPLGSRQEDENGTMQASDHGRVV